jgi:hypothetical protein
MPLAELHTTCQIIFTGRRKPSAHLEVDVSNAPVRSAVPGFFFELSGQRGGNVGCLAWREIKVNLKRSAMTTATVHLGIPSPLFSAQSRWITDWRPEDEAFSDAAGKQVARRNLIFSILSEHIGFSVWSIWSTERLTTRGSATSESPLSKGCFGRTPRRGIPARRACSPRTSRRGIAVPSSIPSNSREPPNCPTPNTRST